MSYKQWNLHLQESSAVATHSGKCVPAMGYVNSAVLGGEAADVKSQQKEHAEKELKKKKAWELAISPFKSLPMTAFMMYMIGNSLQIFTIFMLGWQLIGPIKSAMAVHQSFAGLKDPKLEFSFYKLVFVVGQLVVLGVVLVKCSYMGLVPTWQDLIPDTLTIPMEYSTGSSFRVIHKLILIHNK